jgi:hypothetical protein
MPKRREQLIVAVTERLGRVCADWPPDEFADLVLRVVETTAKYESAGPAVPKRANGSAREWGPDVQ